jgi:isocitrate dehydrogenase kinase/phosphatase
VSHAAQSIRRGATTLRTPTIAAAAQEELEAAASEAERIESVAALIHGGFTDYYRRFRQIAGLAKAAFEARDWPASIALSQERLGIYGATVETLVPVILLHCPDVQGRDAFWAEVEERYLPLIEGLYHADLAYAFLNSVRRQVHAGMWRASTYSSARARDEDKAAHPVVTRVFDADGPLQAEHLVPVLTLAGFSRRWRDLDSDAAAVAARILEEAPGADRIRAIEMADAGFYRNRGAYLVGRLLIEGGEPVPLGIALLYEADGIHVDAVILGSDDLQYVFSSTLANFHVTSEHYHEMASFLFELMPDRPHGLQYSTIGYNHIGKIAVIRQIERELKESGERLDHAVGPRGTVAIGFSAPSLGYVAKVIRDRPTAGYKWGKFPGVRSVLQKYSRVHEINRAGSMLDNVIYYNVTLPADYFTDDLRHEILENAGENVIQTGAGLLFRHLIVQIKMTPFPVFMEQADEGEAEIAIGNLGQCIANNAAANIFNKDLDGRNYGVSKILKVYLFDYDAIEDLTDVKVRTNQNRFDGEEDIPDWFFEEGVIFLPEELETHLRIEDRSLRRIFRDSHGELLTMDYWTDMQSRLEQGQVPRLTPYREACRLHPGS